MQNRKFERTGSSFRTPRRRSLRKRSFAPSGQDFELTLALTLPALAGRPRDAALLETLPADATVTFASFGCSPAIQLPYDNPWLGRAREALGAVAELPGAVVAPPPVLGATELGASPQAAECRVV